VDVDTLTTAAVGLGIIAAGVWNGLETYRTKHEARAAAAKVQELAPAVHETHRQVSVNRHVSNPPTLLDKVDKLEEGQSMIRLELLGAAGMFEGHMNASADDRAALWEALKEVRRIVGLDELEERKPE
jgi:hypothetical protein